MVAPKKRQGRRARSSMSKIRVIPCQIQSKPESIKRITSHVRLTAFSWTKYPGGELAAGQKGAKPPAHHQTARARRSVWTSPFNREPTYILHRAPFANNAVAWDRLRSCGASG